MRSQAEVAERQAQLRAQSPFSRLMDLSTSSGDTHDVLDAAGSPAGSRRSGATNGHAAVAQRKSGASSAAGGGDAKKGGGLSDVKKLLSENVKATEEKRRFGQLTVLLLIAFGRADIVLHHSQWRN